MKLVGVCRCLAEWPIWRTSVTLLAVLVVIPLGRSVLDGFMYNISFTSMVGDPIGLLTGVLIVATILQRGPVHVPNRLEELLQSNLMHFSFAFVSLSVGMVLHFLTNSRSTTLVDLYHDLFILPLFIYLEIVLIPIVFFNGTKTEKFFFVGFVALWLVLFATDLNNNLMNQHLWLYHHTYLVKTKW